MSYNNTESIVNHQNFAKLIDVKCAKGYRRLRFNVYVNQMKTLDKFCLKLIDGQVKSRIGVCFGDASYNPDMKGSRKGPRRLWLLDRLKRVHHLDCVDIWEFNTSKMCSKCHHYKPLVDCKTALNPYSVRSCTNCQTI